MTYKIVRHYALRDPEEIKTGLTLNEAQDHCKDPETSSRTCKLPENIERTEKYGRWFDAYYEEE